MSQTPERIGNWGRWGAEDERGTLNLITGEVVLGATRTCRTGKVYSLALPIERQGPVGSYRNPPLRLTMINQPDSQMWADRGADRLGVNEDFLAMSSHTGTHMDPLCHTSYDRTLYNGFSVETVKTFDGALRCGIDKVRHIVGRAVLLDMAGYWGVEYVEPPRIFTSADLLGCASHEGVEIRSGDILLIRTGWLNMYFEDQPRWRQGQPGIGLDACKLIRERDVSAVGADNSAIEAIPFDNGVFMGVHVELLRNLGLPLMEYLVLDELARDQAYESFLVVAPLVVTGGMGSPINPIAIG